LAPRNSEIEQHFDEEMEMEIPEPPMVMEVLEYVEEKRTRLLTLALSKPVKLMSTLLKQ
jgi:hypothetical protein